MQAHTEAHSTAAYVRHAVQRPPIDAWYIPKVTAIAAYNSETNQFIVRDAQALSLTKPNPSLREAVQFTGITEANRLEFNLELWIALHTDDPTTGTAREVCCIASSAA